MQREGGVRRSHRGVHLPPGVLRRGLQPTEVSDGKGGAPISVTALGTALVPYSPSSMGGLQGYPEASSTAYNTNKCHTRYTQKEEHCM